ncbi:putative HAM-2, hyphal anastomosis-2 protein [Polychaeton citri CBS 116435]|uniref:HAM-2, hyphal anastomosis-2 protein n=1 Tax=Polychaeton citri CBS 116435 TaxID=1314669 RepID=A0A9P4QBR6_9PEZI|nr:putative HAM-2, hyphal anastomosis-2 protein [Polychaeton citri CBS 116435]
MDEVENPALPPADAASPTIPPIDGDSNLAVDAAEALIDSNDPLPTLNNPILPQARITLPARPSLKRDSSNPGPPSQPPPAPPSQPTALESNDLPQDPQDSLTLADLKRIRSTFPNEQIPQKLEMLGEDCVYDFKYQDAQSFPAELEEWFSYSDEEETKLRLCKAEFNRAWWESRQGESTMWIDVTEDSRRHFVEEQIQVLRDEKTDMEKVQRILMILTYITLGVWEETAGSQKGLNLQDLFQESKGGARLDEYQSSSLQIQWIVAMIDTLHSCNALAVIYDRAREVLEHDFNDARPEQQQQFQRNEVQPSRADESVELWCCLTLMYLFIETARTTTGTNSRALKEDILALQPNLLNYFMQTVARLRWDETAPVPLTKMLLLSWKTILVTLGGITDVEHVKASLRTETERQEEELDARGQPIITASPLDYHLFRQEIGSKYPAYQPPAPMFALEPENNSILPPLKHRRPSHASSVSDLIHTGAPSVGTGSIMHQPIHIATPAPSPPPSPAGPGKAGKKQNYQTNQMFPFLYPPLGPDSDMLGGKGTTELQDALVGRRWEGSDVPTSILEAAELFAKRMRATRSMQQLWETRVEYMKYERGWKGGDDELVDQDVDEFELVEKPEEPKKGSVEQDEPELQTDEQKIMSRVDGFYRDSLPHLQSVVIVLLKAVLQNVTDLVTKGNGQNGGLQAGIHFADTNGVNGTADHKPMENGLPPETSSAEELDKRRSQEVAAKALSAIILLLLKWFKVNHILQYEYMTQLLLDSNYVPLILKLWQTQDIGRACHFEQENPELKFFWFCQVNSRRGIQLHEASREDDVADDDEDEAAPPPIRRNRSPQHRDFVIHLPEIDELGYPQTALPAQPLKSYSWRNLFTSINYLRILQKITRRKTHRTLLLVSYKSSNHLKKTLRIPVEALRYYTLKLFKSQVPFCGRKWRQSNMKVITAVWLSVPAELRDDWLTGGGGGMGGACVLGDVDGSVEDALPLEQALRALTHWWNVRNFGEAMGLKGDGKMEGLGEEEVDFFQREREKLELMGGYGNGFDGEGMDGDGGDMGFGPEDGAAGMGPIEGY